MGFLEEHTGEPDAVKAASPVRRGVVGKVLIPATRLLPTLHQLKQLLLQGPQAAGFDSALWTCRRVAQVIAQTFGVSYHPDHVGRLLHGLGFSCQYPQHRARERDEEAIRQWRLVEWPRIKKKPGTKGRSSP